MDANIEIEAEIAIRLERVAALRRSRLQWLLDDRYDGHQGNLAGDIEMNAGELSQLLRGNRFFGEKKARRLEAMLKQPHLWLDGAEVKTPEDRVSEDFHWIYRYASKDGRVLLHDILHAVNSNFVPADKRLKLTRSEVA